MYFGLFVCIELKGGFILDFGFFDIIIIISGYKLILEG